MEIAFFDIFVSKQCSFCQNFAKLTLHYVKKFDKKGVNISVKCKKMKKKVQNTCIIQKKVVILRPIFEFRRVNNGKFVIVLTNLFKVRYEEIPTVCVRLYAYFRTSLGTKPSYFWYRS